jgi:plastocyanin
MRSRGAAIVLAATASAASAAKIVRGNAMRWRPATVTIARGGAVKWKAVDVHHTVHSYGSNWTYSKELHPGSATATRTFNRRGTYRFYCTSTDRWPVAPAPACVGRS